METKVGHQRYWAFVALLTAGCGQAMVVHDLNELNRQFDERLRIGAVALPPALAGRPYVGQLTAAGGRPPYAWEIIDGSLPAGLTLDRTTGAISGTPGSDTAGVVVVELTDASGNPREYVTRSLPIGPAETQPK